MTVLLWFLSPIGRYVGGALVVLSIVGVIYGKGRIDDHKQVVKEITQESTNDVKKSDTARTRAVKRYHAGRLRNDGFARD